MELQQQRSYVLPNNASLLQDTLLDITSEQRSALQESSDNWPHEFNTQTTLTRKRSRSPNPTQNVYARREPPARIYFTSNVHAQHIGLPGFLVERSPKQVGIELKRLQRLVQRSEKYQKYRDKQPNMSPEEVIAKDAKELAEKKAIEAAGGILGRTGKIKRYGQNFLKKHSGEVTLVRWPPMGRKKQLFEGALRGRNELIQDSIRKDTGIIRDRKQVSSHLQVLKQHLHNQHAVLIYMASDDKKSHRGRDSSHAYHLGQPRDRHHPHPPASVSKFDYNTPTANFWAGADTPATSFALPVGHGGNASASPYSVTDFTMFVNRDKQTVHSYTRLPSNGRIGDLHIMDTTSWRRQYPEFDFLRSQLDDWSTQNRNIIACDASIKLMTAAGSGTQLYVDIDIHSQRDLSIFESLECTTRFYDSGDSLPDPQFDDLDDLELKEDQAPCEYRSDPCHSNGYLKLGFGSKFWVKRMFKYQKLGLKSESSVSKSLLCLTATQDIYGIKPGTGEAECVLTILWRFTQTGNSTEVGSMNWRTVSFGAQESAETEQKWILEKDNVGVHIEHLTGEQEEVMDCSNSAPQGTPLYQQVPNLPLDFVHQHAPQQAYVRGPHAQLPPQPHLDVLASMQPDLEQQHSSAALRASTDYSQQNIPNLTGAQDAVALYAHNTNDFNLNNNHITSSGALEPTINLYDSLNDPTTGLEGLDVLAGLDQDGYNLGLACADSNSLVDLGVNHGLQGTDLFCYSIKPNWHNANLISHLENAAEQYHTYVDHGQATHGHDGLLGHHALIEPNMNQGL
ncbi:TEA/ATTS domain family-domain-containing protein [Phaeosphaeriaceae sp. PMI808]|nr:TEA/ATTS domain family-domain-containing protein [Phaeosphaeriaceae sp. PMI808]